ncbi:MAG: ABC transporter substrate-binding protein [Chloroflexota bacterium]
MNRVKTILKRVGKILLGIVLVLVVLIGSFVVWLSIEPEEVTECEAEFRLIENGSSPDCVPEVVNRALAFGPTSIQFFLAVEFVPVARIGLFEEFLFADLPEPYDAWSELTEDVPEIGGAQPNLEMFLSSNAQVIISDYDFLSANKAVETIAPIIILDAQDSWKENLLLTSDIIGEREAAEVMIADYDRRVQTLRAQFDDPAEITISLFIPGLDSHSVQLPGSFGGQIISEVGFSFPEAQMQLIEETPNLSMESLSVTINQERLDVLDGDAVFIIGLGSEPETIEFQNIDRSVDDEFLNDPLIQQLSAVQEDAVYPGGLYWSAHGIYSAHAILDDLFLYVAGVDPEEVAPNPLAP